MNLLEAKLRPDVATIHQQALYANQLSTEILSQDFMAGIKSALFDRVYQAVLVSVKNDIDVHPRIVSLKSSLIERINSIDLHSSMDTFKEKLTRFHRLLQVEKLKIRKQTWSRYKRGYKFLMQYNEYHMLNQTQLTEDLLSSNTYVRNAVTLYYRKMLADAPEFQRYPRMSKRIKGYRTVTRKVNKMQLLEVEGEVRRMYEVDEKVLACDLWACTTLGFRREDMLKIHFRCGD